MNNRIPPFPLLACVIGSLLVFAMLELASERAFAQQKATAKTPHEAATPEQASVAEATAVKEPAASKPLPTPPKPANIEGAFGMKLGDNFDPADAISKTKSPDGSPCYQFKPKKPFRSFNCYYVSITPKTRKICGIFAYGPAMPMAAAKVEQSLVIKFLKEKYGEPDDPEPFDSLNNATHFTRSGRAVGTKVEGLVDGHIRISYFNLNLVALAQKERLDIEAGKVDPSGL